MADYDYFEVIAVGDNPDELMAQYDKNLVAEPQLIYRYSDAEMLKAHYVQVTMAALLNNDLSTKEKKVLEDKVHEAMKMPTDEFYFDFTSEYSIDPDTNDAYSVDNPKGKWTTYKQGRFFSVPFVTKDGKEIFQAKKGEVDWPKMHKHNIGIYESAWDMVMGDKTPVTEEDKIVYENMKNRTTYFQKFGNKENYVTHSTSFWAYGIVDKNGWNDLDDVDNDFKWVSEFYNRFIEPLDDDTLLTIFECRK